MRESFLAHLILAWVGIRRDRLNRSVRTDRQMSGLHKSLDDSEQYMTRALPIREPIKRLNQMRHALFAEHRWEQLSFPLRIRCRLKTVGKRLANFGITRKTAQ